MKPFNMIVALDQKNGIGKNKTLPWHLPEDLKYFKTITLKTEDPEKKNVVVMGRATFESIPEKYRPLTGRINIVLSRKVDIDFGSGVLSAKDVASLSSVIDDLYEKNLIEQVFIIGGEQIFNLFIREESCRVLYITSIASVFDCDTFFPPFEESFELLEKSEAGESNGLPYRFLKYARK